MKTLYPPASCSSNDLFDGQEVFSVQPQTRTRSNRVEHQVDKQKRMRRGIFILLAIGTSPSLFINPGQYLFGLLVCGGLASGLAWVLV